jgi:hypothetical protein
MKDLFPVTGAAPKAREVHAVAFHDAAGRIHHMHHVIILEGARSIPEETMMKEARQQAEEFGVDVSKLQALRVTDIGNPHAMHRVDVEKKTLVELNAPEPFSHSPAISDALEPEPLAQTSSKARTLSAADLDYLEKLAELHGRGVLTDEQFFEQRRRRIGT